MIPDGGHGKEEMGRARTKITERGDEEEVSAQRRASKSSEREQRPTVLYHPGVNPLFVAC